MVRTHLKIFHDEQWSHLLEEHYGIKTRPNVIRHTFSWTNPAKKLQKGFKSEKPQIFSEIDKLICVHFLFDIIFDYNQFIKLADNRMMMGDFRYGKISEQRLDLYDVQKEYKKRMKLAYATKNKEYVIDVYNMYRIEALKQSQILWNIPMWLAFQTLLQISENEHWPLISVDDGEHATEK